MLSKTRTNLSFEEKLRLVDETIAKYKVNRDKMIIENQQRDMEKKMGETRVKSLRIQAQQNYIVGYYGLRKEELIRRLDKRINDEIILTIPKVMFNKISSYLTLDDKRIMNAASKDMRNRTKESYTMLEKQQLKYPRDYMDKMISKILDIKNFDSYKNRREFVKLSNKITNDFDMFYPSSSFGSYKTKIVEIVKHYLHLCERCFSKDDKVIMALAIMKFVTGRTIFIKRHVRFAFTVKSKMEEFDSETAFTTEQRREMNLYREKIMDLTKDLEEKEPKPTPTPVCPECGGRHN